MPAVVKTDLAYYLYNDSRPRTGRSSYVQKGLVPGLENSDAGLCEEGVGFGLPVLQYARDFYFPGTADTTREGKIPAGTWQKRFQYDLVERTEHKDNEPIHAFSWAGGRFWNRIYKSELGGMIMRTIGPPELRWRYLTRVSYSRFLRVRNRGWASSTYVLDAVRGAFNITVNLDDISHDGLQKVYVSNEMGGRIFTHYLDDGGLRLSGDSITGWSKVHAKWAVLYAPSIKLGFRIDIPRGVSAFRGRETFSNHTSWSGVILSIPPSANTVEYEVRFGTLEELIGQSK